METVSFGDNNHCSWHPAMKPTGRTGVERDLSGNTAAFLPLWNAGVGTQTMYCSDCHGSNTQVGTAMLDGGEDGNPWGPHSSNNDFLLKGEWSSLTGTGQPEGLCFKCHDYDVYANPNVAASVPSGFSTQTLGFLCAMFAGTEVNLHNSHAKMYNVMGGTFNCTACHVAVPHGWKNKVLVSQLE